MPEVAEAPKSGDSRLLTRDEDRKASRAAVGEPRLAVLEHHRVLAEDRRRGRDDVVEDREDALEVPSFASSMATAGVGIGRRA